jgi:myo-inositol-1(or 4)-monophosphatase
MLPRPPGFGHRDGGDDMMGRVTDATPSIVDIGFSAHLAAVAAAAATSVGEMLRDAFRTRPEVELKRNVHDPVTVHDRAAEERIRAVLGLREPGSRVVGEEGGAAGEGRVHWYVDPIDGTANFAHGLPYFCTSIAAVVDDKVVAGAIYDPLREDLFTATLAGAWCNGQPLTSVGATTETEAMLLFGPGLHLADRAAELVHAYRAVRITGSAALNLAHVAAGWSDVYIGAGVEAWDIAAGALMVTAAGGQYRGLRPPHDAASGPAWAGPGCLAAVGSLDLADSVALAATGWP